MSVAKIVFLNTGEASFISDEIFLSRKNETVSIRLSIYIPSTEIFD